MDIRETITSLKQKIDKALQDFFEQKAAKTDRETLKRYYQILGNYVAPVGGEAKRVRPVLVEVSSGALRQEPSEKHPPEIVRMVGCAIELLHNASLVHDDIIDNDEFRRGEPSFHTRYRRLYEEWQGAGKVLSRQNRPHDFARNMGILGGDHTYFIGLEILLELPVPSETKTALIRAYQQAFDGIVEGVIVEEHLENHFGISMEDYLFMVQMKTAHLLAKSTEMGLILGGALQETKDLMNDFMQKVGQSFQVRDDILGTFGDAKHKPTDSDIQEGKKTALLTFALESSNAAQRSTLERVVGNATASLEDIQEVRSIFKESGALHRTEALLDELSSDALRILEELKGDLKPEAIDFYKQLVDYVAKRSF